jgi:hypothetical protein
VEVNLWTPTRKSNDRVRGMADRHYTRRKPGSKQWARPGYNYVLHSRGERYEAAWCWWRPKWEDGRPGTERKDGLRVVECTIFRLEGVPPGLKASDFIRDAVAALCLPEAAADLHLDHAGEVEFLLTGVASKKTASRRSRTSPPGACFLHAGWEPLEKKADRADAWLRHEWPL